MNVATQRGGEADEDRRLRALDRLLEHVAAPLVAAERQRGARARAGAARGALAACGCRPSRRPADRRLAVSRAGRRGRRRLRRLSSRDDVGRADRRRRLAAPARRRGRGARWPPAPAVRRRVGADERRRRVVDADLLRSSRWRPARAPDGEHQHAGTQRRSPSDTMPTRSARRRRHASAQRPGETCADRARRSRARVVHRRRLT